MSTKNKFSLKVDIEDCALCSSKCVVKVEIYEVNMKIVL